LEFLANGESVEEIFEKKRDFSELCDARFEVHVRSSPEDSLKLRRICRRKIKDHNQYWRRSELGPIIIVVACKGSDWLI